MQSPSYWIVKGNPGYPNDEGEERDGNILEFFSTEKVSTWLTYRRIPDEFKKGDRIFFWSSRVLKAIVALGVVERPRIGEHEFSIRHLPKAFPQSGQVNIGELKKSFSELLSPEEMDTASYLKSGAVATIYRVSQKQARIIVGLLAAKNPGNSFLKSWSTAFSQTEDEVIRESKPSTPPTRLEPRGAVIKTPARPSPIEALAAAPEPRAQPMVFISYSWDDPAHKKWVRELATQLRRDGVNVKLDQWELAPGDDLPAFMEGAVRESHFVLIICTPTYKTKADSRKGGVGFEETIMTGELYSHAPRRKFIPILRGHDWLASSPSWLRGSYRIDLRGTPYSIEEYQDLINTLHGQREAAPPIGEPPAPVRY